MSRLGLQRLPNPVWIFCNILGIVISTDVQAPISLSDHSTTILSLGINSSSQTEKVQRKVWKYSLANSVNLNSAIEAFDWDSILNGIDCDTACQNFTSRLLSFLETYVPNHVKTVKPKDMPWFTANIGRAINKRNKYYRKMATNHSEYNVMLFKEAVNNVKHLVTRAKTSFKERLCNSLNENSTSSKNYWHILRQLLGKKFDPGIPSMCINNSILESDPAKSELFMNRFSMKFHHDFDESTPSNFNDRTDVTVDNVVITKDQVRKALLVLDPSKQGGEDGISNRMLKLVATSIDLPLSNLFNKFIQAGQFPSGWKLGIVVPIFKNKGARVDPDNYRPVCLLNSISKVFERLVYNAMYDHLSLNNLLFERQSGFMPGHDTQKQLIHIVDKILIHFESKKIVRGIFLDIAGAFDGVPHYLLTRKLAAYGIKGNLLSLLTSYLHNRSIKVRVNGSFSNSSPPFFMNCGVPQGSILGPLLFLIYINDLHECIQHSMLYLYADDCSLFFEVPDNLDSATSTQIIQGDLNNLSVWSSKWKLKFKASKSKEVIFHSARKRPRAFENLELDGEIIPRGNSHKHLGFILDTSLTFNDHLTSVVTKCNLLLNPLKGLKHSINSKHLEKIYYSFILPHLEYCSVIFDSANINVLSRLDQVHYRAGLIVSGCVQGTNHQKVFNCLGWSTLGQRRTVKKLTLIFDVEHNLLPAYVQSSFIKYRRPIAFRNDRLRNQINYNVPVNVSNRYTKSTVIDSIRQWNSLPVDIKSSFSRIGFKYRVKLHVCGPKNQVSTTRLSLGRKSEIYLNKARCDLFLKAHFYAHHYTGVENPICKCGNTLQTTKHVFLNCPLLHDQRTSLFTDLGLLPSFNNLYHSLRTIDDRLDTLLNGHNSFPTMTNSNIIDRVSLFLDAVVNLLEI